MNTNRKRLLAQFEAETRFELQPAAPPFPFRESGESQLEVLKNELLRERLWELASPGLGSYLRRAANEALVLAQATAYPLLVFPVLFEERAEVAVEVSHEEGFVV